VHNLGGQNYDQAALRIASAAGSMSSSTTGEYSAADVAESIII
jgi:hypothetical protein